MNTSEIRKENNINLYNEKGERHGYWEYYWSNGQLDSKGNYINGKQIGYWEVYFDNGQLWSKGNYVAGNRHGYWEVYFDNGQLFYKGNFVNGNEDGYWESYFDNGQLFYKGNYVDGNRHGYWEDYFENGDIYYKGYYDMDKRVDYNPDEQKVIELENAREVLRRNGFFVDNLWHINDVKTIDENVSDDKAQRVLNLALSNEATMEQIWLAIKLGLEQE